MLHQLLVFLRRIVDRVGIVQTSDHPGVDALLHLRLVLLEKIVLRDQILQLIDLILYVLVQNPRCLRTFCSRCVCRALRLRCILCRICRRPVSARAGCQRQASGKKRAAEQFFISSVLHLHGLTFLVIFPGNNRKDLPRMTETVTRQAP